MIPFAEWLPDLPELENPGATEAKNVLPHAKSYLPLKAVSQITDAINARARGAISARDKDNNTYGYVGNETKLYSIGQTSHTDVTRLASAYALSSTDNWKFAKFGDTVYAACLSETLQSIALGGANFADVVASLKAGAIANVGEFIVLGNINDGTSRPNRVKWPALGDPTDYTPNADTQSDFQDLFADQQGGGRIQDIKGGEYGTIFMEYSIFRMTYVGSPLVFQFDEVLPGIGTPCKNSVTQEGRIIHFLSQDGFVQLVDGTQPKYIGKNKVDDYFFNDFDASYPERVIAASDPISAKVFWLYPGTGNTTGRPNKILIYDWINDKWSRGEDELEWIYTSISPGYTLEQLDSVSASIDALGASLDSRDWKGGELNLAVYDDVHKKGSFSGTPMDSIIETGEMQLYPGKRGFVQGVRPLVDGSATVQVGYRDRQQDSINWTSTSSPHADTDIAPFRNDARYQRIRVNTTGTFSHAQGADVFAVESGHR